MHGNPFLSRLKRQGLSLLYRNCIFSFSIRSDKMIFLYDSANHLFGYGQYAILKGTMDSTVTISVGGFIKHSANLSAKIGIFFRSIKCCLLIAITALCHMEDIQELVELILLRTAPITTAFSRLISFSRLTASSIFKISVTFSRTSLSNCKR